MLGIVRYGPARSEYPGATLSPYRHQYVLYRECFSAKKATTQTFLRLYIHDF